MDLPEDWLPSPERQQRQLDRFRERLFIGIWPHNAEMGCEKDCTIEHEWLRRRVSDTGLEIELLYDPGFDTTWVRVGDRFGSVVNYAIDDEDDVELRSTGWDHFCKFVDYGPYLPPEERPEHARSHYDYKLHLQQIEDDEHRAKMDQMRKDMEARSPLARRVRREVHITKEIYGEDFLAFLGPALREPDALIYCTTTVTSSDPEIPAHRRDKQQCRELIGKAFKTSQGWWLEGQTLPMKESIPLRLEAAFRAREQGMEFWVEHELNYIDALDKGEVGILRTSVALSEPKEGEGFPVWLLLGCPRHGNAAIDYKTMREWVKQSARTGKGVSFDCSRRILGTLRFDASERTFLAE